MTIELHQEHRRGLTGVLIDPKEIVDGMDAAPIHDFHARRQHPSGGDQTNGLPGRFHRGKVRQQHSHAGGLTQQTQGDGRRNPQGSLAADEDAAQVQFGGLRHPRAQGGDAAIGQNDLHGEDVVARHAVLQAVHPAGVFGDVAADAAGHLAGRIRRVIKAIPRHRAGDPAVDHPGFNRDALVRQVNGDDPAHATGGDHQGGLLRQGPAGEARSTPAGNKRNLKLVAQPHHRGHLIGGLRQDHQGGLMAMQRQSVAVVGQQLLTLGHHRARGEQGPQPAFNQAPVWIHSDCRDAQRP